MSGSSEQDPIKLAMDAEQDLNSNRLKQGVEKGREGKNAGDSGIIDVSHSMPIFH